MENHWFKEKATRRRKEQGNLHNRQETTNKMALVSSYESIIILNVSGLNSPIKWHRVAGWIEHKTQETHFNYTVPHKLKVMRL